MAAITFTQLIDGLWIGWIMDDEIYGPREAEQILHDWVVQLFETAPALRSQTDSPASES